LVRCCLVLRGGGGADFAVPILIVKDAPSSRRFAIAARL
jgi:hypothetical protein